MKEQATAYGLTAEQLLDDPRPLRDLAHALFNHKEFIYLQ